MADEEKTKIETKDDDDEPDEYAENHEEVERLKAAQAAMAARSGTELAADARSFPAPLFPAPFQEMLADAGTIFTASEGRIRQFALDSLEIAAPAIDKIREDCRKAMPKVAKERYERAFEAFTAHFANMGVEDTTQ